jgi:hypothetical protein
MLLTPFFLGFFWKKKYLYTVIDYNDGLGDQSIVLDFHSSIEKAQSINLSKDDIEQKKRAIITV